MDNLEQKIEEIKAKAIKDIEEAIKEAENGNVKSKRWRGDKNKRYLYVAQSGETDFHIDDDDATDNFLFKTRNYFRTQQEAEEHLEKINIYYELMDLAEELNGDEEIDWNNYSQRKCKISYDNKHGLQLNANHEMKNIGEIYCLDSNFLDIAKERIGEEKLKKIFM